MRLFQPWLVWPERQKITNWSDTRAITYLYCEHRYLDPTGAHSSKCSYVARPGCVFVQIGVAGANLKSANTHIVQNTLCTPCARGFCHAFIGAGVSVSTSSSRVVGTPFMVTNNVSDHMVISSPERRCACRASIDLAG